MGQGDREAVWGGGLDVGGDGGEGERGECWLKRGENPWAETQDGRGRHVRWGHLLTIPERLKEHMQLNWDLRVPSLEVDILHSGAHTLAIYSSPSCSSPSTPASPSGTAIMIASSH